MDADPDFEREGSGPVRVLDQFAVGDCHALDPPSTFVDDAAGELDWSSKFSHSFPPDFSQWINSSQLSTGNTPFEKAPRPGNPKAPGAAHFSLSRDSK